MILIFQLKHIRYISMKTDIGWLEVIAGTKTFHDKCSSVDGGPVLFHAWEW